MKKLSFLLTIFIILNFKAQISPPGLGETNMASWNAIGLRQNLNTKTELMTYLGFGIKSDDESYNPVSKPAILVVNQEFYHQFKNNLKVSYAGSYRFQLHYLIDEVSKKEETEKEQELRIYGRIAYSTKIGKVKLTQTYRQELRKFVQENWKNTEEPFQIRSRLKSQASVVLNKNKQHTLSAAAEILFSSSKDNNTKNWSNFKYKEARFSAFYTYRPQKTPIAISFGYMNNLIEKKSTHSVHYASLDLVWENPFSKK